MKRLSTKHCLLLMLVFPIVGAVLNVILNLAGASSAVLLAEDILIRLFSVFLSVNVAFVNSNFKKYAILNISNTVLWYPISVLRSHVSSYIIFGLSLSDVIGVLYGALQVPIILFMFMGLSSLAQQINRPDLSAKWKKIGIAFIVFSVVALVWQTFENRFQPEELSWKALNLLPLIAVVLLIIVGMMLIYYFIYMIRTIVALSGQKGDLK